MQPVRRCRLVDEMIVKFLNSRYLNALFENGRIRIGTAKEFRIPDGIDDGRSDPHELVTQWKMAPGKRKFAPDHPFLQQLDEKGRERAKTNTFVFPEGTIFSMQSDCYILSASTEYSKDLALTMWEKFDADACVQINDPQAFMLALSQHELLAGRPCAQDRVRYGSNEVDEYTGDDLFLKRSIFEWQKEFRTVWGGLPKPNGAIIIDVPAIIPFLERITPVTEQTLVLKNNHYEPRIQQKGANPANSKTKQNAMPLKGKSSRRADVNRERRAALKRYREAFAKSPKPL
jgi:hypothetical protein